MPRHEDESDEEGDRSRRDDLALIFPGREESKEEVREKVVGPTAISEAVAGRHPPAIPRPEVGRLTDITRGVEQIVDNTALLQALLSRVNDIQQLLVILGVRTDLTYHRDYVFSSSNVTSGTVRSLEVSQRLNRLSRRGWFKKDTPTGTINLSINGEKKIEVNGLETLSLDFLEISSIEVSTDSTSTLNYRLLVW